MQNETSAVWILADAQADIYGVYTSERAALEAAKELSDWDSDRSRFLIKQESINE